MRYVHEIHLPNKVSVNCIDGRQVLGCDFKVVDSDTGKVYKDLQPDDIGVDTDASGHRFVYTLDRRTLQLRGMLEFVENITCYDRFPDVLFCLPYDCKRKIRFIKIS